MTDTEILKMDWIYPAEGEENSASSSSVCKVIADVSSSCCYQCAAVSDDRQLLAVATSNDNVLLYNIQQSAQMTEFVGHTG